MVFDLNTLEKLNEKADFEAEAKRCNKKAAFEQWWLQVGRHLGNSKYDAAKAAWDACADE